MKNIDNLSKGYTPVLVGIVLYVLLLIISWVTQGLDFFGLLLEFIGLLFVPVIIGYLAKDYVKAIIFTIISLIFFEIVGLVVNRGVFSFTRFFIGLVIVAVFSVVGAFLETRFIPKSTNTSPTS